MRAESVAQRRELAALQIQTGLTRSQRYANPLVYTLAALCLLSTTVVCALLGRRSRDRAAVRWLTSEFLARSPEPASPAAQPAARATPSSAPTATALPSAAAAPPPPAADAAWSAPPTAPVRALTVEELADLEQQADFFIALGQEDAAIELLSGAVDRDAGASAMPLLRLLDLHRRVGDRTEYTRVRARLDRRFNARPPDIDADPSRGRTLADHPAVVARLQAVWPTPAAALAAVDALVLRRSLTDERFELPAFGELLFLQAVAADHVARAGVDVGLLPPVSPAAEAALPLAAPVSVVDVDVDLGAAPAPPFAPGTTTPARRLPVLTAAASQFDVFETTPSAQRRTAQDAGTSTFVDLELEFPEAVVPDPEPR